MFYFELEDVLKFLAIVLFAICCQVPGRRLSDDFFIPRKVYAAQLNEDVTSM